MILRKYPVFEWESTMTKKKKKTVPSTKPKSPLPQRRNLEPQEKKPPSHFLSERMNRAIGRVVKEKGFESIDDANKYLNKHFIGRKLDDFLEKMEYDPIEEAQELAFKAMEAENPGEMIIFTLEALVLDPNCIDALMQAAQISSTTDEDLINRIKLIISRAEKNMGEEFINENKGHFWGVIETRPYMRALGFLAEMQLELDQTEEAIQVYEKMLDFNPHDNQGIRYILIGLYLEEKNLPKVRKLLKEYDNEPSAVFQWGHVLERFLSGDLIAAKKAFKKAEKRNPLVLDYLTAKKRVPDESPALYTPGEESEAIVCFEEIGQAWLKYPEAIVWLQSAYL